VLNSEEATKLHNHKSQTSQNNTLIQISHNLSDDSFDEESVASSGFFCVLSEKKQKPYIYVYTT